MATREDANSKTHWTMDRRVPVVLIFGLLTQSATIVWWARGQEAKDDELNRRVGLLEKARETDRVAERLSLIEFQIKEQGSRQVEMNDLLRKLYEKDRAVSSQQRR